MVGVENQDEENQRMSQSLLLDLQKPLGYGLE